MKCSKNIVPFGKMTDKIIIRITKQLGGDPYYVYERETPKILKASLKYYSLRL